MIEVSKALATLAQMVDPVARAAIAGCHGVRAGTLATTIFVDEGEQNVQKANSLLDNWNSLLVATTQTEIDADNVDTAVITINTPDANMDYYVWLDGVEYSFGNVAAVAGVCTLNLATDTPGWYTVILARKSGNYATGQTIIEAV